MKIIVNALGDVKFEQIKALFDKCLYKFNATSNLLDESSMISLQPIDHLEPTLRVVDSQQFTQHLQLYVIAQCFLPNRGVVDEANMQKIEKRLDEDKDQVSDELSKTYINFKESVSKWEEEYKESNSGVVQVSPLDQVQSLIASVSLQEVAPTQGASKQ